MDEFDVSLKKRKKRDLLNYFFFIKSLLYSVNIGQNNPSTTTTTTTNPPSQPAASQATGTNLNQQTPPTVTNIPGVVAGGLDFSNIARSIGNMVQGITGRLIPGATVVTPNFSVPPTTPSSTSSSSSTVTTTTTATSVNTTSTQNSNTRTSTTTNNNENDAVTGQMLQGNRFF